MIWRTALCFTQFWLILALASGNLTNDQKGQILDLHNQYRSVVNPQAANMQRMIWDDATSQVAANYAALCIWDHNSKIVGLLGENLFMTLGPLTITLPLELWFNETADYNLNTNSCNAGKQCGHYTQMVWANTTFVGCAAQFCSNVRNFGVQNATILVCNYYPPGNVMGQSPYTSGPACSSCPTNTTGCVNKTCDRGTGLTSGITPALIQSLSNTGNLTLGISAGSFTKPSAATILLTALLALYIRMT